MFSNSFTEAKVNAENYVSSMLEILGDAKPLTVLSQQERSLAEAVSGLSQEELEREEAPKKWSIVEVIRHLAETEMVYGYRLRMVISHDTPTIHGFDQDLWASRLKYDGAGLRDFLDLLRVQRSLNLKLIRGLDDEGMHRMGVHEERGPENVARMLQLMAAHDIVHLRQIARIRQAI